MNQFGIHLANGPQDIQRVVSCGFDHYVALEFQADYLVQCPGKHYLRLWHYAHQQAEEIMASVLRWADVVDHIIPWNEPNIESAHLGYRGIADKFLALLGRVAGKCVLHWPALSPRQMYRERLGEWREAAMQAPVVDVHCYGTCEEMLEIVDWYRAALPGKKLLVTEFNFGAGREVDPNWWAEEALRFYYALYERPEVLGACGFIWRWHDPDVPLETPVDWEGQPIEAAVRAASKPDREEVPIVDRVAVIMADMWRRQGVNLNPDDAFFKHAVEQARTAGVFIIPQPSRDGYYYTEVDGYLVAYTFPPMYCSKGDYVVRTGLPPF